MSIELITHLEASLTNTRWRSLKLYNLYRIVIALMLLLTQGALNPSESWQSLAENSATFLTFGYFAFSLIAVTFTWLEKPKLETMLPLQIMLDVAFIVLIMHAQGTDQGGTGLLLIIAIASASLISEGRLALFYAAIATIALLLEQAYSAMFGANSASSYYGAVLLSLACFATAWLAYSLAKRTRQSELIATQRSLDVQNLAQINALITQEMQDGVLVVDENMQVKHRNAQAEALLGLQAPPGEPTVESMRLDEISPEIASQMQHWLDKTESLNESAHHLKVSALGRELRINFLPVAENRSQGAVIFIEDWSQMQTQAHQVKLAALGRLTANIAHEIRNPLSAISHANQLLQEEEDTSPATKRMLQIISDNVQRLDQIIKDVLELNRRDRTNQESIQLAGFISDFYQQFCAVEKIPESSFKLTIDEQDSLIAFDRRHLNQILWNLCKNGWRHSKQLENSLKLTVQSQLQSVQIDVSDDGEGIPENVSVHLFEPFFTTEKTGTGLGLYIARELADANGAKLQFTNIAEGAQFTMSMKKIEQTKV